MKETIVGVAVSTMALDHNNDETSGLLSKTSIPRLKLIKSFQAEKSRNTRLKPDIGLFPITTLQLCVKIPKCKRHRW